ncbi:MAG: autotransporter-associated beta strand repeat-containing protein [Bacteroidaceae bacterium]|nr:autotransporter-associated beta strand repeat-containing protein [Bacteroidaceae bacterium]
MNILYKSLICGALVVGSCGEIVAQTLAFPGAEGWGRYAVGGRYGSVYHVTNLNDSGTGSLRDAVSQPNRIVVFDVAGVIKLNSRMTFAKNLYVAGQTAPGEGITVYGNGVSFSNANNTICRYMRFRMGAGGDNGKDCAALAGGTNMIFDHCSFAWGRDETFSINPDGKSALHSITIQNCIVGQGLMSHSAGGLMQADSITLYRNFYCDNSTRNNKVKGRNQYVNNVVYNWKDGAYIMGGDSEGESFCNIVGNLFVNGPVGNGEGFSNGNKNFHCYVNDNYQDKNKDGVFNPSTITFFAGSDVVATPYKYPTLPTVSATSLIDNLIPTVGASLPYRDYVDCYLVDELLSFGKDGALISNEGSLFYGVPSSWTVWKGNARQDSDNDGMPDEWENANGTNPSQNDAMKIASNGYTNIENYLNGIVEESTDFFLRKPINVELVLASTTSLSINWHDWTRGEDGFEIELKSGNGSYEKVASTSSDVTSFVLSGLTPATAYSVRIRAVKGDKYSDYSDVVTFKTRPVEAGIVDVDTYVPDVKWTENVEKWDLTTTGWDSESSLYSDGSNVLFDVNKDATVAITEAVSPKAVVVKGDKMITFNGSGKISGATSLNKDGDGTLAVSTQNDYKGATVLHRGVLSFSTLKNGGVASAIGASEEFAQNWVFDGGTYEYTGSTTSTNRSARVLSESSLSVAQVSSVVTMNGSFEGDGNLIIDGKGTVKVNTVDFFKYSGSTILKGGKLQLPTPAITNAGIGSSSKLVFAGGHLVTAGETEGYENFTFPIEVKEGTVSQFSPNRNCYIKSRITGSGTLQINVPYVREYVQGEMDNFTGRLVGSASASGNLLLLNGKSLPKAVLELKNGIRLCGWDTNGNYVLGGLSGAAGTCLSGSSKKNDGFTCTWNVGGANTEETFRGSINNWSCSGNGHVGTVNIIKSGDNVWRLTGTNDYKGTTKVQAGRLVVNGSHTGTGTFTVSKDATLAGTGSIAAPVTLLSGAELYAGDTLVVNKSTLTIKGTVTANSGSIVTVPLIYSDAKKRINSITFTGNVTLTKAVLNLSFEDLYSELDIPVGTEFKLFNFSGKVTGSFATIQPSVPGNGRMWDTSELYTKGIIRVVEDPATGIRSVDSDSRDASRSFDLNGIRSNNRSGKIIIRNNKKIKL